MLWKKPQLTASTNPDQSHSRGHEQMYSMHLWTEEPTAYPVRIWGPAWSMISSHCFFVCLHDFLTQYKKTFSQITKIKFWQFPVRPHSQLVAGIFAAGIRLCSWNSGRSSPKRLWLVTSPSIVAMYLCYCTPAAMDDAFDISDTHSWQTMRWLDL